MLNITTPGAQENPSASRQLAKVWEELRVGEEPGSGHSREVGVWWLEKTEPPLQGTVSLIGAQLLLRQWEQEGEYRTFHEQDWGQNLQGN